MAKLGCLNERTVAVHCVALSDHDIELLAESGASVVHCPVSNMRLGCGASPVVKLLKAGVNVALGTDGAASACSLSMFEQMRTAGLIAKGFSQDPTQLTVNQIIRMATINGANALKLDREVGSLAVGKSADLAAIDITVTTILAYVWHTSMLSGSRRAAIIAQSLSESFSQKVGLTARNSYVPLSYSRCSSLECRTHCSTAENFANM